jgi:hypothetical protein
MKRVTSLLLGLALSVPSAPGGADEIPSLRCSPLVLEPGSASLRLDVPLPHGGELAVVSPSGIFYFLAHEPGGAVGLPMVPTVPAFASLRVVMLDPRTLEGWRYRSGEGRFERVFVTPGVYEFRVAHVLQSDDLGDPMATCRVAFAR